MVIVSIAELLDDSPVDGIEPYAATRPLAPAVKARLVTVLRVRDFATQALALPDNDSYRVYADLDRAQVAWNVVATPEFSLTPKEWCFPVAGCVPYRGYFSHKRARQFADELRDDRLDERVAGVAAYSTLGWFRDPVFSTQLHRSDTDIAALVFHELAHQQLYAAGDTVFSESFATLVEQEGMIRWLRSRGDSAGLCDYLHRLERQRDVHALLNAARDRLRAIYTGNASEAGLRAAKANEADDHRINLALNNITNLLAI